MKKMYNQPITEVASYSTEQLMDVVTASPAGSGGGGGTQGNDAPARHGVGPAVPGTGL